MPDDGRLIVLPGPLSQGSQTFLYGVHSMGLVHMDAGALEMLLFTLIAHIDCYVVCSGRREYPLLERLHDVSASEHF